MLRAILLASAAASVCVAAPAFAQPASSETGWQGFYAGVNVGFGGNEFKYPVSGSLTGSVGSITNATASGELSQTSGGFLGGGQVGYNFQFANGWILGAEADIDGSGIEGKDKVSGQFTGTGGSGSLDASIGSQIDYLGTVRARLGVPVFGGRFVPYVTGGLAYGQVKSELAFSTTGLGGIVSPTAVTITPGGASISSTSTRTGWTLGAGADYALTDRLSFRAEYLYVDLGENTLLSGSVGILGDTLTGSLKRQTTANVVRVGMNYRFGG